MKSGMERKVNLWDHKAQGDRIRDAETSVTSEGNAPRDEDAPRMIALLIPL